MQSRERGPVTEPGKCSTYRPGACPCLPRTLRGDSGPARLEEERVPGPVPVSFAQKTHFAPNIFHSQEERHTAQQLVTAEDVSRGPSDLSPAAGVRADR